MNLAQLHYFRKLAQLEHYTQAAQELFISQPSLSASISSMEEELQIKLFQKKGRNVKLTKDGKEFYDYVCRALDTLQDGIDSAHERSGSLSGMLEIAGIPSLLMNFLPDRIAAYQKQVNSQIKFHIHNTLSIGDMVRGLNDGTYDLGFSTTPSEDLISVPIASRDIVALLHPANPLTKKAALTLADLEGCPLTTYRNSSFLGSLLRPILQEHDLHVDFSFDDELTVSGYLAQNEQLVAISADTPLFGKSHHLTVRPLADMPQDLAAIYLLYSKTNHITKPMEGFLSFLQKKRQIA